MTDIVYVLDNDQAGEHAFNFELSGSGGGSDEADGGDTLEILPLHSQQPDGGQEVTYIQVITRNSAIIFLLSTFGAGCCWQLWCQCLPS